MIFNYWKNVMGFAFAPLYISGGAAKTVASVALPAIGFAVAGPIGAAAGGALAGGATGGGIKGMVIGGITGYAGGKLAAGGFGSGGLSGIGQSVKSGLSNVANFFGGPGAYNAASNFTGANMVRSLGGTVGAGSFAGSASLQGIAGATARGISSPQFFQSAAASPSGIGNLQTLVSPLSNVTTSVGGDAERIYQKYVQSQQPVSAPITEAVSAPNLKTGLSFNREGLGDFLVSATGQYQDELASQQLDALRQASGDFRSEFSQHYAAEAKKHQDALARGELPETYNAALSRTADEITRRLVAQGHNPAESGFGRDTLARGLVDLESKFLANERSYWAAVGGGADTMNAQMLALEGQLAQAQQANVGAARTQTVKSLLNLGNISTTPSAPSLNLKIT